MNATRAEQQLLSLIRGDGARDFTITVSVKAGHWIVQLADPNGSGHGSSGEGATFADAWQRQQPWWAQD
jgi:hypothetical protein